MNRRRIKNVLILILLLLNIFLGASLSSRLTQRYSARHRMIESLVSLFDADGIKISSSAIPLNTPPDALLLSRDVSAEHESAIALLGRAMTSSDRGGGIYSYNSVSGAAIFRSNGEFDAAGSLSSSPHVYIRNFCRDFSYREPEWDVSQNGSASVTAVYDHNGTPVHNCTVTFSVDQNRVMTVSGTLLSGAGTATTLDNPLSAIAALEIFQRNRRSLGAVVSEIRDVSPCYELQNSAGSSLYLMPCWCISTDTANYYVNCSTGAITS